MKKLLVVAIFSMAGCFAYAADISGIKDKANSGDSEAQYNLAVLYAKGDGVKKNPSELSLIHI